MINKNGIGILISGVLALIFCCGLLILSYQVNASAQTAQNEAPVIPLEGLDPVLLTQGKEVLGKTDLAVTRGPFQYLFSTAETKATFERNPERYEIQLGATCARMGAQVGGNPDTFSVYKERIYIFGSNACKQRFDATPEKFLEPAEPPLSAAPEAIKRGQEWIAKAVAATGGVAKLDALVSYQDTGLAVALSQQGTQEIKTTITKVYPDQFRRQQIRSFGTVTDVISPAASFSHFSRDNRSNMRMMTTAHRLDLQRQLLRNPLDILRLHKQANFKAVAAGSGSVGDASVEQIFVTFDHVKVRVGIAATTGQVLSLTFTDRNAGSGEFGEIVLTFADFRTVDGVTLPFKTSGTFNGQADPQLSYTIASVTLNGKVDAGIFTPPKPTEK